MGTAKICLCMVLLKMKYVEHIIMLIVISNSLRDELLFKECHLLIIHFIANSVDTSVNKKTTSINANVCSLS